jgi:hypothetical protein
MRKVTLGDSEHEDIGIHRYLCLTCDKTVSFLPDFCVPYKHYSAPIIAQVLLAVVLAGHSVRSAARAGEAGSGYCARSVRRWVRAFTRNCQNLRQFALPRLGLGMMDVLSPPDTLRLLLDYAVPVRCDGADSPASTPDIGPAQCALTAADPPYGIFRAQLLPGTRT